MTTLEIIMVFTTLAGIFTIYCIVRLYQCGMAYRRKWHEAGMRVIILEGELARKRVELDTVRHTTIVWQTSAHDCAIEIERLKEKTAILARTSTDLSVTVDELLNGDKVCPNGHRYYDGNGRCPHCGALALEMEVVEHGIQ